MLEPRICTEQGGGPASPEPEGRKDGERWTDSEHQERGGLSGESGEGVGKRAEPGEGAGGDRVGTEGCIVGGRAVDSPTPCFY